ncbi:HAD-IA family hydrolase [Paenibacillus spongiae]|uniref:HAD-IA family hydrolase n=1 Tax=Paenibacillus spongiae TaxID=2909671 RepID=A0ABY5S5K3_9BACL|nr:HAD-IA family hydrolase [Paenibacillus spongiae]UVI28023.1 HAD-IA family hydrolase [Paenibacillus spongiae]
MKPQLILDIAGVLVSNLSSDYWGELAHAAGIRVENFKQRFNEEIKADLWTGRIDEGEFWAWVKKHWPAVDIHQAQLSLSKHLVRLPAYEYLPQWSEAAEIHLLSNHRHEWLAPHLEGIERYLTSMTISSVAGCRKPDPVIYERVQAKLNPHAPALFVDDQERNLEPARSIGWRTLAADESGEWIAQVEAYLQGTLSIPTE